MNLPELTQALLQFRDERNWAQFHTLRNLIVSLNLEAAELLELTQWKSEEEMLGISGEALRDDIKARLDDAGAALFVGAATLDVKFHGRPHA